ncbi:hypothetical protein [Pseudomonas sp. GZD-209]|uniref:hypothetical protein n=1 Tax=Pseudomonas sp. GZD-209 TaxID=3404807 RepID=UPI003BB6AB41
MGKKNRNDGKEPKSDVARLIDSVASVVSKIAAMLPTASGDLLNFGADFLAVMLIGYLWWSGNLPKEQIFLSLVVALAFMLICFSGAMLMRLRR